MSFVENNIKVILEKLYDRIKESEGVKSCLKKGSCNFENWVQLELCDVLYDFLKEKESLSMFDIEVEKGSQETAEIEKEKEYTDIFLKSNFKNERSVAIEIKTARLGGNNKKTDVKKRRIKNDIDKLMDFNKGELRILLCVVYKWGDFTYGWGPFESEAKGQDNKDYRKMVLNYLNKGECCSQYPENDVEKVGEKEMFFDCFVF